MRGLYQNSDITRNNPSCFLFLIDQSSSMAAPFGEDRANHPLTKAEAVALALNNLLRNLLITCSKSDGIRNYFDVCVIGYGANVGPAWSGPLAGQEVVTIRDVAQNCARILERTELVEDGFGEKHPQTVRTPVWVSPVARGSTLMCEALRYAHNVLEDWLMRNATCFPPVIVHITDGEATDGDPAPLLAALGNLTSLNGQVTLFNVHLSSRRAAEPLKFPDTPDALPLVEGKVDPYARMLFETASPLTSYMRTVAWENGLILSDQSRAFVLNADPTLLVLALEIGTRPGNVF
ncbi:MAG TPA: vWA domain-containing protein [Armatimonadaceae bacterium]|nr:vWA domain-containing protein [Armatimonadaceae bacterium]